MISQLLYIIAFVGFILLVLIVLTFFSVYIRKRRKTHKEYIKALIFEVMGSAIIDETYIPESTQSKPIEKALSKNFWKTIALFNQVFDIIQVPNREHLLPIFNHFKIAEKLDEMIKDKDLYQRALALMYSYELRTAQDSKSFEKNVHHENRLVRREAMIGVVVYEDWKLIDYLQNIEYFISLWQQIRIIEKLKMSSAKPNKDSLLIGLQSSNNTVKELIFRIIYVFKIEDLYHLILESLVSENDRLRELSQNISRQIEVSSNVLNNVERPEILKLYSSLKTTTS